MHGPLSGIKVVEMSTFVAAPVTARLMADMGAEVIKVESPAGDGWRKTGVSFNPRFTPEENPVFDIYNTGKKHVSLNLKTPEGKEVFHKLLSQADVFITNTRPSALKRLGFSYEDVKDLYPKLIYAIVLGYGEEGPESHKPAFDTTAFWSRSGFLRDLAVVGEEYYPVTAPSSVGDTATGYLLLAEINAALFNRTHTGKGDYVRSTLFRNGIFCMGTMAIITQKPFGNTYPRNRLQNGAPGGSFRCADDEWVFIALGDPTKNIPAIHEALGLSEIMEDPRFQGAERVKNMEAYYPLIRDAFLTKTAAEWVQLFDEADVPLVRMSHFSDVSEDPQAWANGFLEHVQFPSGNTDVMPSSPIEMGAAQTPPTVPAPGIGANTVEVLESLGYTREEVEKMVVSGAAVAQ